MSRGYSNHFDTTGVSTLAGTTTYSDQVILSAGLKHARTRTSVARATVGTAGMTSGDEVRMLRLQSGDRLLRLEYASDGGATTYAANLGLYLAGPAGDGAAVDADLFSTALALASGSALVDTFVEGGDLTDEDRGKTLWELAAIGDGTDTQDPFVEYDLVFTSTATGITVVNELLLVATYTSGD